MLDRNFSASDGVHTILLNSGENIFTSDTFDAVGGRMGLISMLVAIFVGINFAC